jgi:hypothetical protein
MHCTRCEATAGKLRQAVQSMLCTLLLLLPDPAMCAHAEE